MSSTATPEVLVESSLPHSEHLGIEVDECVRSSFAALEALQEELAQWQAELTEQQEQLTQQQAKHRQPKHRQPGEPGQPQEPTTELKAAQQQLEALQKELGQLEEENTEQLQTVEELERDLAVAHAELAGAKRHHEELGKQLTSQRDLHDRQQEKWSHEFAGIRELLGSSTANADQSLDSTTTTTKNEKLASADPTSRTAAMRKRASARRSAKRRSD